MDVVFQGRSCFNRGLIPDYMTRARRFFEQALALDPENIEAMVGLARVDQNLGASLMTDDRSARLAAAETTIIKVLSLAPNHASAHAILGAVEIFTKRADRSIAEFEQALALDRNLARAHALIGLAKLFLGRGEETEPHVNEAFRLSPRDTFAPEWLIYVGLAKAQLGADAEAVSWMRRGLDANRSYSIAHFFLGAALARLGELEQARTAIQAGLALDPDFTIHRFRTHAPRDERLIEGMRLAGVPEG
jgi:tetratricopeptide (TPR) repeat protein